MRSPASSLCVAYLRHNPHRCDECSRYQLQARTLQSVSIIRKLLMNLDVFLAKLASNPEKIEFSETMGVIDQYYDFVEAAFRNGALDNSLGENSGSCKLFSFAKIHQLDETKTLACFGSYYRDDVLKNPDAENHQNIRNFMDTGWGGIVFSRNTLTKR